MDTWMQPRKSVYIITYRNFELAFKCLRVWKYELQLYMYLYEIVKKCIHVNLYETVNYCIYFTCIKLLNSV